MIIKLVLSLVIFCSSSYAATSYDPFLRYLAESWPTRNLALYSITAKRCSFYLPASKVAPCEKALDQMFRDLGHDMVFNPDGSYLFVIRKKELLNLLTNPKVSDYLSELLSHGSRVKLWKITLNHFPVMKEAIKVIAVLFQDTSFQKLHLQFIEQSETNPGENLIENITKLSMLIDQLRDGDSSQLYPTGVPNLGREIYHFYVPLHLSLLLQENRFDTEMSYVAPLLLTLTYEFVTAADDYRYLFRDPSSLTNEHKINDIFRGHSGAAFAIKKKTVEHSQLKEKFNQSVKSAVELIL